MNKIGKTSTIFLVIFFILLISFTAITVFFFQKEKEMRKSTQDKLSKAEAAYAKLDAELKDAKQKVFVFEEKNKEADEKINNLLDELELEEGLREELKLENIALQETLDSRGEDRKKIQEDLIIVQEKVALLEDQLKTSEEIRSELEEKIKAFEEGTEPQGEAAEFEQVTIAPGDIRPGKVLRIDTKNNFVIFDLGRRDGITDDMVLSVSRGKKQLGDIKVSRVQAEMSVGDPIPPLTSRKVRKDDKVVIKE